jgi:hypothetical protein
MLAVDRLLDEQDARDQALQSRRGLHTPPARALGYTGVSSKCCKGLYILR